MKTLKLTFSGAMLSIPMLAVMLSMAACGNRDDGGGAPAAVPPPPPPIIGGPANCPTCPPGTSFLFSTVSDGASSNIEMQLQYFSTMGVVPQVPGSSFVGTGGYSGPVSAVGVLYVKGIPNATCPIPPGAYQLQPAQPGQMQYESIYGISLQAVGPIVMDVAIVNTFIMDQVPPALGTGGMQFPYRLQGRVQIRPQGLPQLPGYPNVSSGCYVNNNGWGWDNYLDLIMN